MIMSVSLTAYMYRGLITGKYGSKREPPSVWAGAFAMALLGGLGIAIDIDGSLGELGRLLIIVAMIVGIIPVVWRIQNKE